MEYSLKRLLGLQAFKINGIETTGPELIFAVTPRRRTADCPRCHRRCSQVHGYFKHQRIKHIRIGSRLSLLSLTKRRFDCDHCGRVFTERIGGIKYRHRISQPAKEQVLSHLVDRSFRAATKQTGIGYHSSRRYLTEKVTPFIWDWSEELTNNEDISLGMDEISFSGHDMIRVLTNVSGKKLKTILPDDTRLTLWRAVKWIPPNIYSRIKEVAIDLSRENRLCVKKYFPQAKVVADRFHVLQYAKWQINEERMALAAQIGRGYKLPKGLFEINREDLTNLEYLKLKAWFSSFPSLRVYWQAKETLRDMYRQRNKAKAAKILDGLIARMAESHDRDLKKWGRTLARWYEPILNFFDKRTTNGFTEGVNTKLKLVKRISYGFRNREVFIRKAMLAFIPFAVLLPHLTA